MYLPAIDPQTGGLRRLSMTPFRIQRMRLNRASAAEAAWLRDTVQRASYQFSTAVDLASDGVLMLG